HPSSLDPTMVVRFTPPARRRVARMAAAGLVAIETTDRRRPAPGPCGRPWTGPRASHATSRVGIADVGGPEGTHDKAARRRARGPSPVEDEGQGHRVLRLAPAPAPAPRGPGRGPGHLGGLHLDRRPRAALRRARGPGRRVGPVAAGPRGEGPSR